MKMKNVLIGMLVFVVLGVGCKKEETFDYSPSSLIGTWVAQDTTLQFGIFTVQGKGDSFVNYLEINNEEGRYLQTTFKGHKTTYKVLYATKYIMSLQDSTTRKLNFNRVGD